jgi:hypothetical protein
VAGEIFCDLQADSLIGTCNESNTIFGQSRFLSIRSAGAIRTNVPDVLPFGGWIQRELGGGGSAEQIPPMLP